MVLTSFAWTIVALLVAGERQIRKGAADAVRRWPRSRAGRPAELNLLVDRIARSGSTPLAVADGPI